MTWCRPSANRDAAANHEVAALALHAMLGEIGVISGYRMVAGCLPRLTTGGLDT
jgi:hypothetical protein